MQSPDSFDAELGRGNALASQDRPAEAAEHFRRAVAARPESPVAHNSLGNALADCGQLDEAMASYGRAIELNPAYAAAHNNLGMALFDKGELARAAACYEQALSLTPELTEAVNNLGAVRLAQGDFAAAKELFVRALRRSPYFGLAHYNLGRALMGEGQLREAALALGRAAELSPALILARLALAEVLMALGQGDRAAAIYGELVARHPEVVEAQVNLAGLLSEQGRLDEAEQCCREATTRQPSLAAGHLQAGIVLGQLGRRTEAVAAYRRAAELGAGALARYRAATALPIVYASAGEIHEVRRQLVEDLAELEREGVRLDPAAQSVGTLFYLAYQGEDDRAIHQSAARLCAAGSVDLCGGRRPSGSRVRLGLVSAYFGDHTIGRQWRGNIARLSRERFDVTVFALGDWRDTVGAEIARSAERFVRLPRDLAVARRQVAAEQVDVLLYVDVGMHPASYALACARLAPVQCAFWGHPVTTGLPTIDCYLSSALAEDESAQAHYSERLVRMPSLGLWLARPRACDVRAARRRFHLSADRRYYGCLQSLFKIHPDDDRLLAEILRRDPRGEVVLLEGNASHWNGLLRQRLAGSMGDVFDRVRLLPRVTGDDFLELSAAVDVLLDPIHFSGGRTTYEGLAQGTPVVTRPSPLLRGRLSLAVCRQMDVSDGVASSPEQYVELALGLARRGDFREEVRRKIAAGCDRLFEDDHALADLERVLVELAGG